jgi:hypothetical protein
VEFQVDLPVVLFLRPTGSQIRKHSTPVPFDQALEVVADLLHFGSYDESAVGCAGVFLEVVLVVLLRGIEFLQGLDGRCELTPVMLRLFLEGGLYDRKLSGVREQDDRSVLRTHIRPLTVYGGRIVHLEKDLEELLEGYLGRIKVYPENFGMSRSTVANILIGRTIRETPRVADLYACHSFDLFEDRLGAPEATTSQYDRLPFCHFSFPLRLNAPEST